MCFVVLPEEIISGYRSHKVVFICQKDHSGDVVQMLAQLRRGFDLSLVPFHWRLNDDDRSQLELTSSHFQNTVKKKICGSNMH